MISRNLIKPMAREVYPVGRFAVYFFKGTVGQHHVVRYSSAMKKVDADYRALLCKGRMDQIQAPDGVALHPPMLAGMGTENLPDIDVPGIYIRECVEDSLMICISRNGRGFKFRDEKHGPNETIDVPLDGIFVLGEGSILLEGQAHSGPVAFHAESRPLEFLTTSSIMGMSAWI